MGLGLVYALASAQFGWSALTENWIAPFGTVFINLLKLIAVPLVLFSIIDGVASLGDPKTLGRVGMKTLGLYMATTVLAVGIGLLVVNAVQPGAAGAPKIRAKRVIFLFQWGGPSQIDILDMKPDAPEAYRGPHKAMRSACPDIPVNDRLPNVARIMDANK